MSGVTTETPDAAEEPPPKTSYATALAYEEALDAMPDTETTQPDLTGETPAGGNPSPQASATQASPTDSLRLRMKIWTDPKTSKRYLMPMGLFRDVVRGQPVTDVMYAYALRDDNTKLVILTAAEWNALPFFYFQEDGWAPRVNEGVAGAPR